MVNGVSFIEAAKEK
jgi:hypothetical protein